MKNTKRKRESTAQFEMYNGGGGPGKNRNG
jgi:hypothetical protein